MALPTRRLVAATALWLAVALAGSGCAHADAEAPDAGWTYVGDAACQSCHADLSASYARTGMGRAVSRFDPATAPERFGPDGRSPTVCAPDDGTPGGGYCYEAFVRGDTLFQRETHPDWPEHERVVVAAYVVGSGNATRSYLAAVDADSSGGPAGAFVTEMPLTWYVERALWDLSPGYAGGNDRFDRPIVTECMTCHNGRPVHETSQNFYAHVPLGISCERCHGPASAHVAAYEAGEPEDPQIVNPARLSPALQLDVCQQCHLTGQTVFAPGETPDTYRPGRPLAAHRTVFVTEASLADPEAFGISSHAERLAQSACFTESLGTDRPMTCTTCHDPHVPTAELPPDHMSAACQSCHATGTGAAHADACSRPDAPHGTGLPDTADCASCHMRRAGTSDIPHVSFTDHWIRRDPPPPREGGPEQIVGAVSTPFTLVDVTRREALLDGGRLAPQDAADADAALGIALMDWYDSHHPLPAYLPQAARHLRRALAARPDRADARVALGRVLAAMDSADAAARELARAVEDAPDDGWAHTWLGVARLDAGDARGAADALTTAVLLAPRLTEARLKLAEAQANGGDLPAAIRTLAAALAADPDRHAGAWNDLGLYRLQAGDVAGATDALRRAVALDPRQPLARANLGAARLSAGDEPAAVAQFEAALRLDPTNRAALGNLASIRAGQGRTAEARALLQRLLAAHPTDAQAAQMLQSLR